MAVETAEPSTTQRALAIPISRACLIANPASEKLQGLQPDTAGTAPAFRRDHHAGRHAGARMPKQTNIYDLVERAAARRAIPRLELWENTAKALIEGDLPAVNLSDRPAPQAAPKMTLGGWLRQFREAVDRGSDPNSFKHILMHIIVHISDFERWLRNSSGGHASGPQHGTTGYQASDRKLFPLISQRKEKGKVRSTFGAALELARQGKITGQGGSSHESRAKRLATLYSKERDRTRG
jgi:hypothetical protein